MIKKVLSLLAFSLGVIFPINLTFAQTATPTETAIDYTSLPLIPAVIGAHIPPQTFADWIGVFISIGYYVGIISLVFTFIIAGIQYIISGDNPGTRQKAIERLRNGLIGFFLLIFFWAILEIINPKFLSLSEEKVFPAQKRTYIAPDGWTQEYNNSNRETLSTSSPGAVKNFQIASSLQGNPAIAADINSDGYDEIVNTDSSTLKISAGKPADDVIRTLSSVDIGESALPMTPAVLYLDHQNTVGIAVFTATQLKVFSFSKQGVLALAFSAPFDTSLGKPAYAPYVADVDGDSQPEIVATFNDITPAIEVFNVEPDADYQKILTDTAFANNWPYIGTTRVLWTNKFPTLKKISPASAGYITNCDPFDTATPQVVFGAETDQGVSLGVVQGVQDETSSPLFSATQIGLYLASSGPLLADANQDKLFEIYLSTSAHNAAGGTETIALPKLLTYSYCRANNSAKLETAMTVTAPETWTDSAMRPADNLIADLSLSAPVVGDVFGDDKNSIVVNITLPEKVILNKTLSDITNGYIFVFDPNGNPSKTCKTSFFCNNLPLDSASVMTIQSCSPENISLSMTCN